MGLVPAWQVTVDGEDITPRLASRLIRATCIDGAGARSDRCTLELRDGPTPVDWPPAGRKLAIALGWDGELTPIGEYAISRPRVSGWPARMTITGTAISHGSGGRGVGALPEAAGKVGGSRLWQGVSLEAMAQTMGSEMGLEVVVSRDVAQRMVSYVEQDGETHASTLLRTATDLGVTMRVSGGRLILGEDGATRSAGPRAAPLPVITLAARDIQRWSAALSEAAEASGVRVRWQDPDTGESGEESAGSGAGVVMQRTVASAAEARALATSSLRRRRGKAREMDLTLVQGDPRVMHGVTLDLSAALRPGVDGRWRCVEVTHICDGASSYTCEIKAEEMR